LNRRQGSDTILKGDYVHSSHVWFNVFREDLNGKDYMYNGIYVMAKAQLVFGQVS
jgi:hypothetical protein